MRLLFQNVRLEKKFGRARDSHGSLGNKKSAPSACLVYIRECCAQASEVLNGLRD